MTVGWRGTIVLAVLVVIFAAYLWHEGPPAHDERPTLEEGAPSPPTTPMRHLVEIDPGDVVGVEVDSNGETRSTQRTDSGWTGAANPNAITDLLQNLTQLGVLMDIPSGPGELQDYGLEPPHGELRLQLRNASTPLVLQIGDRNPATTGVYVRLGKSGPVVLAGALAAWEIEKTFNALRSNG